MKVFTEEIPGKTKVTPERKEMRNLVKSEEYEVWMQGAWEYVLDCLKKIY